MNNVAFLTTIFPMEKHFLMDFFDSLVEQTYKFFDVVVVNDGYKNFDKIKIKYSKLNIIELSSTDTPAKNREYGINFCKNKGYEVLIFGDSDDYFSNNRVEFSLSALAEYDIVVNDLSLFDADGIYETNYMSNRIDNNSIIEYSYVKDKNIFGLSNTAINTNILSEVTFDKNIVAVDWHFYKELLKNGCRAIFINKAITFYRQYQENTVGLKPIEGKYYLWWEKRHGKTYEH